jgi:hypothetical protein
MEALIDLSTPRPVRPAEIFTPGLAASLSEALGPRANDKILSPICEAGDENEQAGWTQIFAKPPPRTLREPALVPEIYGEQTMTPKPRKQKRPPSTPLTPSLLATKITKRRALSERCSNTPSPKKSFGVKRLDAAAASARLNTQKTAVPELPLDALDDAGVDAAIDVWLLRERLADLEDLVEFLEWERQFHA